MPSGARFQNYLLYLLSITSAKRSILITNPYFIPDERMIQSLLDAARRGVRVAVLVPGKIDHKITYRASRRYYGQMLLGGIDIFEYMPALLHSKTMVVDGTWATIGSTNFDNRSFALNEELNLTLYDRSLARSLEKTLPRTSSIHEKSPTKNGNLAASRRNSSSCSLFPSKNNCDSTGEDLRTNHAGGGKSG